MKVTLMNLLAGVALAIPTLAAPALESVSPADGATAVPVNSTVVFRFDTAMTPLLVGDVPGVFAGNIQWSQNITPSLFTYEWNQAGTMATCTYAGNLPAEQLVTWTLNPEGAAFALTDLNETPLPTTSGSFTTAAGGEDCDPNTVPDGFGGVNLSKFVPFVQTSDAAPVVETDPSSPVFSANVSSPADNSVTSATLQAPGGSAETLSGFFGTFATGEFFDTQAELDAAYPAGNYVFSLQRESGGPTGVTITMPAPSSYPPTPKVNSYATLQNIDPSQPLTISWAAFTGATQSDFIGIDIEDENQNPVYSAPDACIPIELPNTATSVTLPANLLQEGMTYTGYLNFSRVFHSTENSPAGFYTSGFIGKQTRFTLTTIGGGGGGQPVIIANSVEIQGGLMRFDVTDLDVGQPYEIEFNTSLDPSAWSSLITTNPVNGVMTIVDPTPVTDNRVYRVKRN